MRFSRIDIAILLAIILTLVTSCGRAMSERLDHIESIIQEYPDSALVQLSSIDTSELFTRRHKAQYALLLTMARDKNDLDILDQNIISPAVSYYRHHRSHDHYAAALFYSGRIAFYNFDYPNALIRCMEALDYAKDLYWRAMINSEIARIYNASYNPSEELKYTERAYHLWEEYCDSTHMIVAKRHYANALFNNRHKELADSILYPLINSDTPDQFSLLQLASYEMSTDNPDYVEVVSLYDRAIQGGALFELDNYYQYAYALRKVGRNGESKDIFDQLSVLDISLPSVVWQRRIYQDEGNYLAALNAELKHLALIDSLVWNRLQQSVFKAQVDHFSSVAEINRQKYKVSVLIGVIVLLVLIMVVCAWRYMALRKNRLLQEKLERINLVAEESVRMLQIASQQNEQLTARQTDTAMMLMELRCAFASMYQRQFSQIGRLLDYGRDDDDIQKSAIDKYAADIKAIMSEITEGENRHKKFEERINRDLSGIMSKLRADFPNFSEDDFRFLSFLIVGFDATTRAILLNSTQNNMRVKKYRLLEKIAASDSPNMELYRCFLFENTKNHYSDTN